VVVEPSHGTEGGSKAFALAMLKESLNVSNSANASKSTNLAEVACVELSVEPESICSDEELAASFVGAKSNMVPAHASKSEKDCEAADLASQLPEEATIELILTSCSETTGAVVSVPNTGEGN
jgi:hypothetical protein